MSFQISTAGLKSFKSYAEALDYYISQPLRTSHDDVTDKAISLSIKRKKHIGMHLTPDKSVAMRLHHTDVVTYHPDGTVTLNSGGYNTMSTSAFGSACAPHGVCLCASDGKVSPHVVVAYLSDNYAHWDIARCYPLTDGEIALRPVANGGLRWEPVEAQPWRKPVLNKKRAAAALKECHYAEFVAWARAYAALKRDRDFGSSLVGYYGVCDVLKEGPAGWSKLVDSRYLSGPAHQPEACLRVVRNAVYEIMEAVDIEEVPWLTIDGVRSLGRLQSTYAGSL